MAMFRIGRTVIAKALSQHLKRPVPSTAAGVVLAHRLEPLRDVIPGGDLRVGHLLLHSQSAMPRPTHRRRPRGSSGSRACL
jgi:hypothetical protein